jgi:hypothetical protein
MLDAVEHSVDVAVESREFVLDVGDRDPPAEIACFYLESGTADRADSVLQLSAKQQSAADHEQQSHRSTRYERMPYEPLDIPLILHVATDNQDRTVG